jgi:hypothetical protein
MKLDPSAEANPETTSEALASQAAATAEAAATAAAEEAAVAEVEFEHFEPELPEVDEAQGPSAEQLSSNVSRLQQELQQGQSQNAQLLAKLEEATRAVHAWKGHAESMQRGGQEDWDGQQRAQQQLPAELDPSAQLMQRLEDMERRFTAGLNEVQVRATRRDIQGEIASAIAQVDQKAGPGVKGFLDETDVAKEMRHDRNLSANHAAQRAYRKKVEWMKKNNMTFRREKAPAPPPFPMGGQAAHNPTFKRGKPIEDREELPRRIASLIDQLQIPFPKQEDQW